MINGFWFSGSNESSVKYIEFLLFDRVDGSWNLSYDESNIGEIETFGLT
jgi:hypothetical protein